MPASFVDPHVNPTRDMEPQTYKVRLISTDVESHDEINTSANGIERIAVHVNLLKGVAPSERMCPCKVGMHSDGYALEIPARTIIVRSYPIPIGVFHGHINLVETLRCIASE